LLRLRSDEQLVALFRAGHEEAFRAIYDRYRQRLFAYTRQMLPGARHDAEDALQDIFVRAYVGLRVSDRELSLRAWLYRVAHNRCVDELRRPAPPAPEVLGILRSPVHDPSLEAEQRESLRRLIADVRRLPEQQRSALLMRELGGMTYSDLAAALGVSIPAVKSLLVRARVGLAQAAVARDTACCEIREELIVAHDRGVRPSGLARRHMRDCAGCRQFRAEMRGVSRQFAALAPTLGPLGVVANMLGIGGGGGGAAVAGGAAGSGSAVAGGFGALGVSHVATLLAAAVVTAGSAVELQHTIIAPVTHHARHHATQGTAPTTATPTSTARATTSAVAAVTTVGSVPAVQASSQAAQHRQSKLGRHAARHHGLSATASAPAMNAGSGSPADSYTAGGAAGTTPTTGTPTTGTTGSTATTDPSTTGDATTTGSDGTSSSTTTGDPGSVNISNVDSSGTSTATGTSTSAGGSSTATSGSSTDSSDASSSSSTSGPTPLPSIPGSSSTDPSGDHFKGS
jgi:RNA polymerase sigma factor (sigma-70 family)